jgi:hypothetical protein
MNLFKDFVGEGVFKEGRLIAEKELQSKRGTYMSEVANKSSSGFALEAEKRAIELAKRATSPESRAIIAKTLVAANKYAMEMKNIALIKLNQEIAAAETDADSIQLQTILEGNSSRGSQHNHQ